MIPNCIIWELWLHRNKGRFENQTAAQASQIIHKVDGVLQAILNSHQITKKRNLCDDVLLKNLNVQTREAYNIRFMITRWLKPNFGRVKLNSDGCSKGNPGRSGGSSLLRSDSGDLIWAWADFYGHTTMVAEIKALLQGVQTCVDRGFLNVDIEVDSLILADVVQLKIPAPWCII